MSTTFIVFREPTMPKSKRFFRGLCAAFPPNSMQIGGAVFASSC